MRAGLRARLLGIAFIAAGAALAWFFGLRPLQQAAAGAREISYDVKLFVAAPLAIVAGLCLLIGGAPVGEAFAGPPRGRRQHLIVWPMFAVAMAAGGLAFWWFDARLHALGYVTGG
jgi:hypothetical protein